MFTNRIIVTLAVLRLQPPHAALAVLCGVDRSTITRAAHGIRPLLAEELAEQVPDQVQAAPLNSKKDAPPETLAAGVPPATSSHQYESASSTPTPSTSSGGHSCGTSDAASTSTKAARVWPAWSPTAPPRGDRAPRRGG
ncbi:hypothetical protein [Streptomyces sp. NBC_01185]|uniref:hypothetical protein n=1 Tax=Streptomyces sp. NBC_01185 TaxID=2903764 RepID=UPI0038648EFB|nr:transposase family protein [Streptomyces sp. NBC_01185]